MHKIGGYLKDPDDTRDALFSWNVRPHKAKPIKKETNLWLPQMQIKDQMHNSCTGFAGSYALRAALAHEEGKDPGNLSGLYLYYTGRAVWGGQDKDDGSYIRTLFSAIPIQGACLDSLFPQDKGPFARPGWKQVKNAAKHRGIKSYRRIMTPDEAREALSEDIPLVGGWAVGENFSNWSGGKAFDKETVVRGGHAMAVMGHNADGTFNIPNTWGTRAGDGGWWKVTEDFLMTTDRLWACDTREK